MRFFPPLSSQGNTKAQPHKLFFYCSLIKWGWFQVESGPNCDAIFPSFPLRELAFSSSTPAAGALLTRTPGWILSCHHIRSTLHPTEAIKNWGNTIGFFVMGKEQTGCLWPLKFSPSTLSNLLPTQGALWEKMTRRGEMLNVNCAIFLVLNVKIGLSTLSKTCLPQKSEIRGGCSQVDFFKYL